MYILPCEGFISFLCKIIGSINEKNNLILYVSNLVLIYFTKIYVIILLLFRAWGGVSYKFEI